MMMLLGETGVKVERDKGLLLEAEVTLVKLEALRGRKVSLEVGGPGWL